MVHGQAMHRQAIVEMLVHRQHMAELEALLAKLPAGEIGGILEALPIEDARLLWQRIPEARENDILWEISDTLRAQLAEDREPGFADSQMNAFELVEGRLRQVGIGGMSKFSMMTQGIPWPIAYGSFMVAMGLIGWGTYVGVKHLENRKLRAAKANSANGSGERPIA